MQVKFSELKQKDVINVIDGRNLGRVCDITFNFPENEVCGITVTGCKGFRFSRQDIFLPMNCVQKIGKDAVLVKLENGGPQPPNPPRPPKKISNCPPAPNNCCPPHGYNGGYAQGENYSSPPNGFPQNRRSLDEYE